jgi:hypothetical protein
MKKILFVFMLVHSGMLLKGQKTESNTNAIDFAIAGGKSISPALSFESNFGIGTFGKFRLGYGIRYTGFFGKNLNYRTAPASLTSGKSSLAALFSDEIVGQIDTLRLTKNQTNALNINIRLGYLLTSKIELGFNIDAIGLTFGGVQSGIFESQQSDATGRANNGKNVKASPTKFNLLLISDSDIGTLNSELYLRYWVNNKFGIRAGASFQFLEYTTENKLAFDNDRFRSKQLLPFIAISKKF